VDVAGTYALAHLEASRDPCFSALRFALRDHTRNGTRNKRGSGLGRAWRRLAALYFRAMTSPLLTISSTSECSRCS
jgi:hypothetical protein